MKETGHRHCRLFFPHVIFHFSFITPTRLFFLVGITFTLLSPDRKSRLSSVTKKWRMVFINSTLASVLTLKFAEQFVPDGPAAEQSNVYSQMSSKVLA